MIAEATINEPLNGYTPESFLGGQSALNPRPARMPEDRNRYFAEFAEAKPFLVEGVSYTCPPASGSESGPTRQLALRAVFGVSRELGEGEILERSKTLPGIRSLARVPDHEVGVIDSACRLLTGLGLGADAGQLVVGATPTHVIREGRVRLVVQTEGGFAPGVRETLLLVARELGGL